MFSEAAGILECLLSPTMRPHLSFLAFHGNEGSCSLAEVDATSHTCWVAGFPRPLLEIAAPKPKLSCFPADKFARLLAF